MAHARQSGTPKAWSYSTGERGRNRVRVYADAARATIFAEFYEKQPNGALRRVRISLGHRDREAAKLKAEELAAAFRQTGVVHSEELTLRALFDSYLREVTPQKSPETQRHDERARALFERCWGSDRPVRTLSRREWDRYIRERRSGRLRPAGRDKARPVRDRQVQYDLKFMIAVLNWATMVSDGRGGPLLDRNPFKGFPVPREENPRRPRLTEEEYAALLEQAPNVSGDFELALVLAHETGHRLSSIRHLRWSDVDLETGVAQWRSEHDKIRHAHTTPLTPAAIEALERARRRFALNGRAVTGDVWIFPGARQDGEPTPRSTFLKWWDRAEELAQLEAELGRGFHSLRRKFASELRTVPLRDLCDLGGWKSAATVLACYQTPDPAAMREALEQRVRRTAGGER